MLKKRGRMETLRRDFLKFAGCGIAAGVGTSQLYALQAKENPGSTGGIFNVRAFGATGDGKTIDTPAVNKAIQAAAAAGGGTVYFPAGSYLCYSIHLMSLVSLYLDAGATIVAADTPMEGTTSGGYDAAEPKAPWEHYQDYGHNHWHNSLL